MLLKRVHADGHVALPGLIRVLMERALEPDRRADHVPDDVVVLPRVEAPLLHRAPRRGDLAEIAVRLHGEHADDDQAAGEVRHAGDVLPQLPLPLVRREVVGLALEVDLRGLVNADQERRLSVSEDSQDILRRMRHGR